MNETRWTTYESPLGRLTLVGGPRGLRALAYPGAGLGRGAGLAGTPADQATLDDAYRDDHALDEADRDDQALAGAVAQLEQYFASDRREFDLELDIADQGTPFQRSVWAELRRIPYGETTSYAAIARQIGRLDRVRAVGSAVGCTPIPIILPCHRVIGSTGDLVGYGGGLGRKRALLALESRQLALL